MSGVEVLGALAAASQLAEQGLKTALFIANPQAIYSALTIYKHREINRSQPCTTNRYRRVYPPQLCQKRRAFAENTDGCWRQRSQENTWGDIVIDKGKGNNQPVFQLER